MDIAMIGQKGIPAKYGGVERHVEELSTRLVERGHRVVVYTRQYFTPAQRRWYHGVRLVSLRSLRTKHLDAISHTLAATIHAVRHQPDVIHYHGVGPSLLSWLPKVMGSKAKVVSTFHCIDRKHQKWGFLARLFLRVGEWSAVHWPDQTIAVSQTIKDYSAAVYDRPTKYIPNGVPPAPATSRRQRQTLKRYGLQSEAYALVVSRLIPHKGVHWLVEAWKKLPTNQKLVIVGDGFFTDDYVQQLKSSAAKDPRIVFTGWLHGRQLHELYAQAGLFVLPSTTEGLPIALLEAASYGRCILTSDIPENREVLATGRAIGYTFRSGDVDDLREKLQLILRRPAINRAMGQRAKRAVAQHYNWERIVSQIEDLYRITLNQTRNVPVVAEPIKNHRRVLVTSDS